MFPSSTRVLIVDDSDSIRELIKTFMRRLSFKDIDEAVNGAEAYRMLVTSKNSGDIYGLILSDWNMPEMNGMELLTKVRSTPFGKKIPFILMTTESEKAKVVQAITSGVSNYIVKPLDEKVLLAKLTATYEKLFGQEA